MNRKTAVWLGAATALAAGPALAAPETSPVPVAASYAELLQPIPNAVERLKAADAQPDLRPARLIDVQYNAHHHHHHHNHHNRRWYIQNGYSWYGGAWVLRPRPHHHHHHHSHY
jgi:hypothetical protein